MKEICIIIFVIVIIASLWLLKKDAIIMPMSWDDSIKDYKKCYHCKEYLMEYYTGPDNSCIMCPFYPPNQKLEKLKISKEKEANEELNP